MRVRAPVAARGGGEAQGRAAGGPRGTGGAGGPADRAAEAAERRGVVARVGAQGRSSAARPAWVRVGARAEVQLNAHPNDHFTGTVEYVWQQIVPSARTVVARIPLQNKSDMLRLGLFGIARIDTVEQPKGTPIIVVPRTAIAEIGGKNIVFVRHPDNDFEVHEVVLGASALGRVEIVAGLREGEEVVVEGVVTLKSAVPKASPDEEEWWRPSPPSPPPSPPSRGSCRPCTRSTTSPARTPRLLSARVAARATARAAGAALPAGSWGARRRAHSARLRLQRWAPHHPHSMISCPTFDEAREPHRAPLPAPASSTSLCC